MSTEDEWLARRFDRHGLKYLKSDNDDVYGRIANLERRAIAELRRAGVHSRTDPAKVKVAVQERRGIPVDVTR